MNIISKTLSVVGVIFQARLGAIINCLLSTVASFAQTKPNTDYPIQPVAFTHVHVNDHFWQPKMHVNAEATLPFILGK